MRFSCLIENIILLLQSRHYKTIHNMELSNELKQITTAYNLTPNEVILCFATAAGAPVADAYKILLAKKTTSLNESERQSTDFLKRTPAAKILINRIKAKKNTVKQVEQELNKTRIIKSEEKDELKTRPGIIQKLIEEVTQISGKDAVSGLQTLAKLQGFDKPDEINEEEKRIFVLTYLSHCRSCALMREYLRVLDDQAGESA